MKSLYLAMALAMTTTGSIAQEAPKFFSETYPSHALGPAMQWFGTLGDAILQIGKRSIQCLWLKSAILVHWA